MSLIKFCFLIFIMNIIFGCVEKTRYSGKIINQNDLTNFKIHNKDELLKKFGQPSYVDTIQNKYFYYTEMKKSKNFYIQKIEYSYLFVFTFDENNKVIASESINLLDKKISKYQKKETENNIIERGLLEKIFGGVGNQLPNSP